MRSELRRARPLLPLALVLLLHGEASACAACGCGDPTLTAAGTEQPFTGRTRVSLEARYRTDSIGEPGVSELEIEELRADAGLAVAPSPRLFLLATVPLVYREVTDPNLASDRTTSVGDLELRAKFFAYRDREFAPRHLFSLLGGLKLPTAPFQRDEEGELLPLEAQAGTGSWDVLLGASSALFADDFSAYGSVQLSYPFATRDQIDPGPSLRATLAPQYQALTWLALRAAADARLDRATTERGVSDPNSGGFVLFAGGDVLVSPALDLTLQVGARVPVVQALNGYHDEGPVLAAAAMYDF